VNAPKLAARLLVLAALPHLLAAQKPARVLDTMSVVASRTRTGEAGRSVDVISRADIERSGARTIADVLQTRMSVDIDSRSPAQADVSIRGSSPEQVVILVDGVRVSDAQSAHYALDLAVPLKSVSRIEILRGGGSALYGPDAVGGVINIVTTQQTSTQDASIEGGSFGTAGGSANLAHVGGGSALTVGGDYEKSDGQRPGTDYRRGQARASYAQETGAGTFRSAVGVGVRDFGASAFYGPYNSTERTASTTLDTRWEKSLGGWSLSSDAGTRRHTDDYILIRDNPAVYENVHKSWQTSGDLLARSAFGPLALALGADAAHDQLSSARLGGRREWRSALFAEGTIGTQAATLNLGLRGDRASTYGAFFSPTVSGAWQVVPTLQLRSSVARGFRAPTWTERYYSDPTSVGNPDLRAEHFWSGDVGARWSPGAVSLDVAGFTRTADELIDWVKPVGAPATTLWRATNIGSATYHGIEAQLRMPEFYGIDYSLFGNGVSLDASQGAALVGKYALRPVTRQLGLRAGTSLVEGTDLHVDLVQARRYGEASYLLANARFGWQHASSRVSLAFTNLLGANWLDASGQQAAGRSVVVGLGWSGR
jgi:iron complex outermembrane receptor protein